MFSAFQKSLKGESSGKSQADDKLPKKPINPHEKRKAEPHEKGKKCAPVPASEMFAMMQENCKSGNAHASRKAGPHEKGKKKAGEESYTKTFNAVFNSSLKK